MSARPHGGLIVLRASSAEREMTIAAGLYGLSGYPAVAVDAPLTLVITVRSPGHLPPHQVEIFASGKDPLHQECYLPAGAVSLARIQSVHDGDAAEYALELKPLGTMASFRHRAARRLRRFPRLLAAVQALRRRLRPSRGPQLPLMRARAYGREIARIEPLQASVLASLRLMGDGYADTTRFVLIMQEGDAHDLRATIGTVLAQHWLAWTLECTVTEAQRPILPSDGRIRMHPPGTDLLAVARNQDSGDRGIYVVNLRPGDLLLPYALCVLGIGAGLDAEVDLLYTDEDRLDERGRRCNPILKSGWNPELLDAFDYLGSLVAIRLRRLPAACSSIEDLLPQMARALRPQEVMHLPVVAVSRPNFVAALEGSGIPSPGQATRTAVSGLAKGNRDLSGSPPAPKVSVIVPTRDGGMHLQTCIESLIAKTRYPDFELIVVDNQSAQAATLQYLRTIEVRHGARVLVHDAPFNFSEICNRAVQAATGAIIVLLNDDTEVLAPLWMDEMVRHAVRSDVGAVGAKLYYPDGTIQHAGVALGLGGVAGHICQGAAREADGYLGRLRNVQAIGAVTGACLAVEREKYLAVGGMDAKELQVAFNDIDLCLKLRERGWRCVWTPHAELIHHESKSRGKDTTPAKRARFQLEYAAMRRRWAHRLDADPYYHPRLSRWTGDMRLDIEAGPWTPIARGRDAALGDRAVRR